jgi:hypothetical protein
MATPYFRTIPSAKRLTALSIVVLTLVGCASPPKASQSRDFESKEFRTDSTLASVYIYRNELLGAAISMKVRINGLEVGATGPKTFFHFKLKPGFYQIQSESETTIDLGLNAIAGKNHFVWQEARMGILTMRSALWIVDEKKGRAGVLESKLLEPIVPAEKISSTNFYLN